MKLTLNELAKRAGGTLNGADPTTQITGFTWDDRLVESGQVFLAIKGAKVDGHEFVNRAFAKGACVAMVEKPISGPHLLVNDLIKALGNLGRSIRDEFTGPVIGVTGSNGKTSVKEMIAATISPLGTVLKTEGNYNSEFTSPLVWTQLEPNHKSAVIEMGMRGYGQIDHLASISKPTIGVITMIGSAHIEMVGSREGIANAKSEMLAHLQSPKTCVFWQEDAYLDILKSHATGPIVTFGESPESDAKLVGYQTINLDESHCLVQIGGKDIQFKLPTIGRHQARNACCALLVAHQLGVNLQDAAQALSQVKLPPMRMESKVIGGVTFLLDNYNASPDSFVAALQTLAELPCQGERMAIIGEMKELGDYTEIGHKQVGAALANSELSQVIFYGENASICKDEAILQGYPVSQIQTATNIDQLKEFAKNAKAGDIVLVKGSRALALESALEFEQ